jgi:hypothetical protein
MIIYGDFILEKVICDLLLESKIEFSKQFLEILSSIKHPIAKDIISLQSQDKRVNYNYIDVNTKTNDEITFIQDARAQRIIKEGEEIWVIDDALHLKIDNFKSDAGRDQNAKIYNLLGFDINEAKKAGQGEKIKILNKVPSPFDPTKIYVLYQSITDPEKKAVININNISEASDVTQKLWTTNRNPLKIGRFITAMLTLVDNKYIDSEKEKFVSEWKSVLGVMNDVFSKFGILEGRELVKFYHVDNYENSDGTLGNSCMSEADPEWLDIYSRNPDVCKLVVKWSNNGTLVNGKYRAKTIVGRALLWKTEQGDMFMDRIYTIDSSDEELFKRFAEKNDWWCKSAQNSRRSFDAVKGHQKKQPTYTVQLSTGYDDLYPYVDTLSYLNTDTGKLSNDAGTISADRLLDDTEGGYEDYDSDDD